MTPLEAAAIVSKATRCTEATLMAFGINGIVPQRGSGCLQHLRDHGFNLRFIPDMQNIPLHYLERNRSSLLIFTHEHAMALVDGILIDTMKQGFDNRKIEHIWEVTK